MSGQSEDLSAGRRVAVVTGASAGIGAAIAVALAEAGYAIALGARREEIVEAGAAELIARGHEAYGHRLDVTDPDSIDAFFDAVEAHLGACDVLVNNAGVGHPALLRDVDPVALKAELDVNLIGPMLTTRRALRSMTSGSGDLVFVTSMNARVARPGQCGYTASKAGIEGVARVLRMELEGTGIRSTVVRPGPTVTDFANDWSNETITEISRLWRDWALWRHDRFLAPAAVAGCVVAAVTADPHTHIDEIQVNPVAPARSRSSE